MRATTGCLVITAIFLTACTATSATHTGDAHSTVSPLAAATTPPPATGRLGNPPNSAPGGQPSQSPSPGASPSKVRLQAVPATTDGDWMADYSATGRLTLRTGDGVVDLPAPSQFFAAVTEYSSPQPSNPTQVAIGGDTDRGHFGTMFDCESARCQQVRSIWLTLPSGTSDKPTSTTIGFPVKQALGWRGLPVGASVESETTNTSYILNVSRMDLLLWKFAVRPNPGGAKPEGLVHNATLTLRVDRVAAPWNDMQFLLRSAGPDADVSAYWRLRKR